ncbi:hypothetical protein ACIBF1_18580 [Spirillospora sp. NPDC050679]
MVPVLFDPTRGRNNHLAFTIGPHVCLGALLETQIVFRELARRLPDLRLAIPLEGLLQGISTLVRRALHGLKSALPVARTPAT